MILSPDGGSLAKMLTPFKLGLGGKIGSGEQHYDWIALSDAVEAIDYAQNRLCLQMTSNPVTNLTSGRTTLRVPYTPAIPPPPPPAPPRPFLPFLRPRLPNPLPAPGSRSPCENHPAFATVASTTTVQTLRTAQLAQLLLL